MPRTGSVGQKPVSSHFVRLNETAWTILRRVARPLDDSVSDAIIRLAFLAGVDTSDPEDRKQQCTASGRVGTVTPHHSLREPVVMVLRNAGGRLDVPTLKRELRQMLADRLTLADCRILRDGDERWWHAAQTQRLYMIRDGLLESGERRGWWQLTETSLASR